MTIGITIHAYQPLVVGTALVDDGLGPRVNDYSHEIAAVGGYLSAEFSLNDNRFDIESWFANGLGRHIEVFDRELTKIWEGFVNEMTISMGGLSVTRGPLLGVINKVTVAYTTITYNTIPPVMGNATATSAAEDAASQGLYGTGEIVLSGGTGTATEMEQLRDTYLEAYKDPETGQELTIGGSTVVPSLTISCRGYVDWLDRYYYAQIASSATDNLSDKLQDVIAANPDAIFSTDYSGIASNTLQVGVYEDDNSKAWSLIKDLVARGDASDNRYLFGVYNGRKVSYGAIPTTIAYTHRLGDTRQEIVTYDNGTVVYPWSILPGKWLFIPDFLIGQNQPGSDFRSDPRFEFIESVKYTAPWQVTLNGSKISKARQRLLRLGMGGIG